MNARLAPAGLSGITVAQAMLCGGGRMEIVAQPVRAPARREVRVVVARGLGKAMGAVADGTLDPFLLLLHPVPLREPGRSFDWMRECPDGFTKAVAVP